MSAARALGPQDLSAYRPPYWCLGEASRHNFGDACRWITVDRQLWFCRHCGHVHDEPGIPRALAAVVPMRYSEPSSSRLNNSAIQSRPPPPPLRIKVTSVSGTSTWLEKGTVEGPIPWPVPQPAQQQLPVVLQSTKPPPEHSQPSSVNAEYSHENVGVAK